MNYYTVLYRAFPKNEGFSLKSDFAHFMSKKDHLALLFTKNKKDILKVYFRSPVTILESWGYGFWCFQTDQLFLEREKSLGFTVISSRNFDEELREPLTLKDSLNYLELWLNAHGICLTQFRHQLMIAIDHKQALEIVNCPVVERNFFFKGLFDVLDVAILLESVSVLPPTFKVQDVLWVEGESSRNPDFFPLYVGEGCPAKKYKSKKMTVAQNFPLKLIFTATASQVFPSITFTNSFFDITPHVELHPHTWLKILQEKKTFFSGNKFEHLANETFAESFDCVHVHLGPVFSEQEQEADLLNQACDLSDLFTLELQPLDLSFKALNDSTCTAFEPENENESQNQEKSQDVDLDTAEVAFEILTFDQQGANGMVWEQEDVDMFLKELQEKQQF